MIRQFKKQIRSWKDEISRMWGRLKSFHRTALGIFLAILMVLAMRETTMDALQGELETTEKNLSSLGVPQQVPPLEEDNDIQEQELRIKSMEESLERARKSLEKTVEKKSPLRKEQKSEAVAETYRLVTRAGLRVKSFIEPTPEESQEKMALPVTEHDYVLEGIFNGIYLFLKSMKDFPWSCRVYAVEIASVIGDDGKTRSFGGHPLVRLSFRHRLYYYDYEQSK